MSSNLIRTVESQEASIKQGATRISINRPVTYSARNLDIARGTNAQRGNM